MPRDDLRDAELVAIDAQIAELYEQRREVEARIQAECDHAWERDILHAGGRFCPKCSLSDMSNACMVIYWPDETTWPHECPPQRFCWMHKQPLKVCAADIHHLGERS